MPKIVNSKFLDRVDDVLGMGEYRKTLMDLKVLGISCVGVEREEKYCADAVSRLRQEVFDFS
jgi:hypothetical protein